MLKNSLIISQNSNILITKSNWINFFLHIGIKTTFSVSFRMLEHNFANKNRSPLKKTRKLFKIKLQVLKFEENYFLFLKKL